MNNNDDAATVAASDMSEIPLDRIEAGASLPAPEEVRMSASSRPGSSSRHRTLNSILCFAVVLILVIICFIVFTDREGLGSSKSSNSDARKFSYESLVDYLVENGISSQEMFYNASRSTPQAMAARWLADEDPRNLALPTEGVQIKSGYHFVTRYVLATMFYAMAGPTWRQKFDFLSFEDVCGWRGIGGYIISTGQPVPAGALCDSNGEVSAIYLGMCQLEWLFIEGAMTFRSSSTFAVAVSFPHMNDCLFFVIFQIATT